eukprot:2021677-Rhodomonas_salina.2
MGHGSQLPPSGPSNPKAVQAHVFGERADRGGVFPNTAIETRRRANRRRVRVVRSRHTLRTRLRSCVGLVGTGSAGQALSSVGPCVSDDADAEGQVSAPIVQRRRVGRAGYASRFRPSADCLRVLASCAKQAVGLEVAGLVGSGHAVRARVGPDRVLELAWRTCRTLLPIRAAEPNIAFA